MWVHLRTFKASVATVWIPILLFSLQLKCTEISMSLSMPLPPPVPMVPQASPYVLHGHSEVAPPAIVQTTVTNDAHAHMDRIEQHMSLSAQFRMLTLRDDHFVPAISKWGSPALVRIPRVFTMPDMGRLGLGVLMIEDCRDIDRPLERDQIQMVLRSLQPRIARHVIGGKKPFGGQRSVDVSAIGSSSQGPLRRHQSVPQLLETHPSYPLQQYRPRRLVRLMISPICHRLGFALLCHPGIERPCLIQGHRTRAMLLSSLRDP
ncbi:hypothetical protein CK203_031314 [Vitis vinifera]|uniref:Uncharacterized protein n=1 Tax=Vitis vinifera TaxID=29760 RepID=A0A438IXA3_VITVI|nr:hypothetical protein CK203_031314 [Vitis vinifera]